MGSTKAPIMSYFHSRINGPDFPQTGSATGSGTFRMASSARGRSPGLPYIMMPPHDNMFFMIVLQKRLFAEYIEAEKRGKYKLAPATI